MAGAICESHQFDGDVELVLNWQDGELFVEAPLDADSNGMVAALCKAEAMGLIPMDEVPPELRDDDTVRIWLTPREGMEVDGWL